MTERVVPERNEPAPDPLTVGPKTTWAAYLPEALVAELKRAAKVDGFKSASGYVETLLVFALRQRELERIADRQKK